MSSRAFSLRPATGKPTPPELRRSYWKKIKGRMTPQEAASLLLKTKTNEEIMRAAMRLDLTWSQAYDERKRLFGRRYGI